MKTIAWKDYLYPFLFISFCAITFLCFKMYFNYFNLYPFCYISFDTDLEDGNGQTIQKALNVLKSQDPKSFKTACSSVEVISENLCPIDHTYGGPWKYPDSDGCFIRGSHIIFIDADKQDTTAIVEKRARAIRKYAEMSQKYWQEKK